MKKMSVLLAALMMIGCSMRNDSLTEDIDKVTGDELDTIITVDTTEDGKIITDTTLVDSNGNEVIIDTSGTVDDQGLVIVSERTETIFLTGGGSNVKKVTGQDTVALKDIRNEIEEENMSLPLFAVTNLTINGKSENSAVVEQLRDVPMVLKVYTMIPGESQKLSIETPDSAAFFDVKTFGELHDGLELNNGLYTADDGSLAAFENNVKDESKDQIVFIVEIEFYEEVTVPEDFSLEFTIEGSSKKKI